MLLSKQDFKLMIGKDDNQEEVSFKVADRRKFNPDGSLKEGVTLEPAKIAERAAVTERAAEAAPSPETEPSTEPEYTGEDDTEEIPGVNDPASFVNFISTLATNAAAAVA